MHTPTNRYSTPSLSHRAAWYADVIAEDYDAAGRSFARMCGEDRGRAAHTILVLTANDRAPEEVQ